jgi:hypothetical protein
MSTEIPGAKGRRGTGKGLTLMAVKSLPRKFSKSLITNLAMIACSGFLMKISFGNTNTLTGHDYFRILLIGV